MCGLVLVRSTPLCSELLFAAPAANNNSSRGYPTTQSRACQEPKASAQVTGTEARLLIPTCRGTRTVSPRNPFFCGNALLHFLVKTYIIIADNKKGRPEGCYQHPSGPMQENSPLPHSRYNCARFSLYPVPCVLSRGRMWLCAC